MVNLGYYRGTFGLLEEMSVPMLDRSCYFGDGVYDATYTSNHNIFSLDEHINRFYHSADLLQIPISYTKDELKHILQEMVNKVDSPEQFLYWQITRGTGIREHTFLDSKATSNLWIMIKPANIKDLNQKYKLITVEDTRFFHCNIKTLNLLPNVMASEKAKRAGCDEVIFHRNGRVTEGAHTNVSIISEGVFVTPPLDNLILPGITRGHLLKICTEKGIPCEERPFHLKELMNADEIIVTSAGCLCMSVDEVDGIKVGGKRADLLKILQDTSIEKFRLDTNVRHIYEMGIK